MCNYVSGHEPLLCCVYQFSAKKPLAINCSQRYTYKKKKPPSFRSASNPDMNDMYISWKKGILVCRVLGLAIKIMGMQNISSILVCTIKQVKKSQCLVPNDYCLRNIFFGKY